MTQVTGNSADPFTYAENPDDVWWSHNAFHYAVNSWLPSIFSNLAALDYASSVADSRSSTENRIIRACLENRMHMFSLLAASSGFMKFVVKLQLDRHDTPEYCMGKALQYLRHHLASETPVLDESLIFDLGSLSTFERYVRNFEGARTHLRMVQHIVQSIGGIEIIDSPIRLICRWWDLLAAAGAGHAPLCTLTWDPGPFSSQEMHSLVVPDLARRGLAPGGSSLLAYCPAMHVDLASIMTDVVQWFQVDRCNKIGTDLGPDTRRWLKTRSYALMHRMLSCPDTTGDDTQVRLSESIKQALLAILADHENEQRSQASAGPTRDLTGSSWSNFKRQQEALSSFVQADRDWQSRHEEVVLWMACLGAQWTARTLPENEEDSGISEWFVELAKRSWAVRRSHSPTRHATNDVLAEVLGRYVYYCDADGRPDLTGLERVMEP
jgi:hypothetical protein